MPHETITGSASVVPERESSEITLNEFQDQFNFVPNNMLCIGIERECFTVDVSSQIVPGALKLTDVLGSNRSFGYEFSACQVEERIGPCQIGDLEDKLEFSERELRMLLSQFGLRPLYIPVAPYDMPMDYYPDPSGRYGELAQKVDEDRLRAAFRVAATHVHVGVSDRKQALRVYNGVITHFAELSELGDLSNGQRLEIYNVMAQQSTPVSYKDWDDLFHVSREHGFVKDPRQCWTLIRISKHGTIEFRMFDTTDDISRIVSWAQRCQRLCEMYV